MEILLATQNSHKIKELTAILAPLGFEIITPSMMQLGSFDVEETGSTFEENAMIKAKAYGEATGLPALADDSGLSVDALDGEPGIHSARYGGKGVSPAVQRQLILQKLDSVSDELDRRATFICTIALYIPKKREEHTVTGKINGHITKQEQSEGFGFAYDAIFKPIGYKKTFAQMCTEIKNKISHRAQALNQLIALLHELGWCKKAITPCHCKKK